MIIKTDLDIEIYRPNSPGGMMKFTPEFIAEAKEIAAKATARPWKAGFSHDIRRGGTSHEVSEYSVLGVGHSCLTNDIDKTFAQVEEDMAYLDEAVNNYPAALDEIERLREAANSALIALELYNLDTENGVTLNGIDEGDVRGRDMQSQIIAKLRQALKSGE